MKRFLFFLCTFLLLATAFPAYAQLQIFMPYDGETLLAVNGTIQFFWDPGQSGAHMSILSQRKEVLFSAAVTPDMVQAELDVRGLLQENTPYWLVLENSEETASSLFYITHTSDTNTSGHVPRAYGGSIGLETFSTENLDTGSAILLDRYNSLVLEFTSGSGTGFGSGNQHYLYHTEDTGSALRDSIYIFPDTLSGQLGDPDALVQDLARLWNLIGAKLSEVSDYAQQLSQENLIPVSPAMSDALEAPQDIQLETLHFSHRDRTDVMLCALLDSQGNPIDGKPYLVVRFFVGREGFLCILDDPALIEEYLAMSDATLVLPEHLDLSGFLSLPDQTHIGPATVLGSTNTGVPLADMYNQLVGEFADDGYRRESGYVIDYAPANPALLNPMIVTLPHTYSAGKKGIDELELDAVFLLEAGIAQTLTEKLDGPVSAELAQDLLDGKVYIHPVCYGLGDCEYYVFALSKDGQSLDDALYLISRMVSEGGVAHLALFTDQEKVIDAIRWQAEHDRQYHTLVDPFELPEPGPSSLGFVTRSGSAANIRQQSNTDSPRVGSIAAGESLPVIGVAENGWYQVLLPDGSTGFISDKIVTLHADAPVSVEPVEGPLPSDFLAKSDASLRSLLYDYSKTSYASAGTTLAVKAESNDLTRNAKATYDLLTDPIGGSIDLIRLQFGNAFEENCEAMLERIIIDTLAMSTSEQETPQSFPAKLTAFLGYSSDAVSNAYDAAKNDYSYLLMPEYAKNTNIGFGRLVFAASNIITVIEQAGATDERAQLVYDMAADYLLSSYLLSGICAACDDDPMIVRICNGIQENVDEKYEELLSGGQLDDPFLDSEGVSAVIEQVITNSIEAFGSTAIEGMINLLAKGKYAYYHATGNFVRSLGAQAHLDQIAATAKTAGNVFSAVIFAGKTGGFLTNQSGIMSDQLETMLYLHAVDSYIRPYAEQSLGTANSYPMYELFANIKLCELAESKTYFEAYGHTVSGLFNSVIGRFDLEEIQSDIGRQETDIDLDLRAKRSMADYLITTHSTSL